MQLQKPQWNASIFSNLQIVPGKSQQEAGI